MMPDDTKEEKVAIKEAKKKFLTHETNEDFTFKTSYTVACIRHLLPRVRIQICTHQKILKRSCGAIVWGYSANE
jgi:hypothetical protein